MRRTLVLGGFGVAIGATVAALTFVPAAGSSSTPSARPRPTVTVTTTETQTVTATVTETAPGPTVTVTAPGPTETVTVTTTPSPTPTPTTTAPGGNNCINLPSACGFADNTNTGPTGALTPYTGPSTITTDGTTIDSKVITGQVTVNADNVTISNSRVVSQPDANCGTASCAAVLYLNASSGGGVYHSEVDGNGGKCTIAVEARGGQTVQGNNLHGCGDGVREASSMTGNWVHDMWLDGRVAGQCVDTPHNDGYQTLGIAGATIAGNTIIIPNDATNPCTIGAASAGINSCVYFGDQSGPSDNDLVTGNLFDCNSYSLRNGPHATRMRFTDNRFVRVPGWYGPFLSYPGAPPYTFTGNVYDNDGTPING